MTGGDVRPTVWVSRAERGMAAQGRHRGLPLPKIRTGPRRTGIPDGAWEREKINKGMTDIRKGNIAMVKRLLFALFCLTICAAVAIAGTGPKISFDSEAHDFGEVVHGTSPTTEFKFTNSGNAKLTIKKLGSDCGCTKGIQGDREVEPGSSSTITAQIHTDGLPPGRHGNTIVVKSNDPQRPSVRLKLTYTVVRHISVEPRSVATALKEMKEEVTLPLRAKNHWTKPITLKAAADEKVSGICLTPREVVVPPGDSVRFGITIPLKEAERRYCTGTAKIETTDPLERTVQVRYLIQIPKAAAKTSKPQG